MQVMKAFYLKGNAFVAIKRINVFEKVPLVYETLQFIGSHMSLH